MTTRKSIPMHSSQDTPPAELQGLGLGEVVAVFGVEHAVREGLARAHAEKVAGEAGAVGVDVVEGGAFLGGHLLFGLVFGLVPLCCAEGRGGRTPANMVPILRP